MRKDARPQNVIDTTEYKKVQAELDAIIDQKEAAGKAYEAAQAVYYQNYDRLCPNARRLNQQCIVSGSNFQALDSLYLNAESLRVKFNELVGAYNRKLGELKAVECKLFKLCG